jgi:hypothetical protein
MEAPMRIGVLAPVSTPVPPSTYGRTCLLERDCRRRGEERFSTEPLVRPYEQACVRASSDGYGG